MKEDKVTEILQCLGVDVATHQNRTGWTIAHCPMGPWLHDGVDHNPSFAVRKESGDNFCNCFSCGTAGPLSEIVVKVHAKNKMHPRVQLDIKKAMELASTALDDLELDYSVPDVEQMLFGNSNELYEFPDWYLDSFAPVSEAGWACNYLHQRGVPPSLWEKFDLRADTQQKRVCIPVYDFKSRLVGLHGRAINDEDPLRYRMYTPQKKSNPIVWLGESWVDFDRPVVWVEGYFDLLSVYRVYDNVVSPLFANPSFEKLKRMSDCEHIVTFYDNGKGGDAGRLKVDAFAQGREVTHLKPPEGVKDPGVMTPEQIAEQLEKIVKVHAPIVA